LDGPRRLKKHQLLLAEQLVELLTNRQKLLQHVEAHAEQQISRKKHLLLAAVLVEPETNNCPLIHERFPVRVIGWEPFHSKYSQSDFHR
jgi:hypothetical protein